MCIRGTLLRLGSGIAVVDSRAMHVSANSSCDITFLLKVYQDTLLPVALDLFALKSNPLINSQPLSGRVRQKCFDFPYLFFIELGFSPTHPATGAGST
jgi:hypothetical protein